MFAYSYGKVFVVIGRNPDKKYLVTPNQRAELTRKMLNVSGAPANIEAKGKILWLRHH
jgi:phosphopantetheine adenylyltransferase